MFKLTPTNTKFYDFFDRATDTLVRAATHFSQSLVDGGDFQRLAAEIKLLEHEGDTTTHQTMELLHKSFITPLERRDIRRLIVTLDDVLDSLDAAAERIAVYELTTILPPVKTMASLLVEETKGLQRAVHEIRMIRRKNDILQLCIEVHRLEDEGDRIYHDLLGWLFKSGLDPLAVVKWKDVIEDLERAIDECQDVANVIEGVVLENA